MAEYKQPMTATWLLPMCLFLSRSLTMMQCCHGRRPPQAPAVNKF